LDETLLSSPQLHSLDTTVYYFPNHPTTVIHAHSELQILKRCLMRGNSIKKLRIAFQDAGTQKVVDEAGAKPNLALWEHGPLNFHWKDGEQFPGLQELGWRGDVPYNFSNTQCQSWTRCMDWSKLRTLDLFRSLSWLHLFQHLAGRVPHLKCLSFNLHYSTDDILEPSHQKRDFGIISEFLRNITGIEKLTFYSNVEKMFTPVLKTLLRHYGHALKRMVIICLGTMKQWDQAQYEEVLNEAPKLLYLRVVTKTTDGSERMRIDFEGEWSDRVSMTSREKYESMKNVDVRPRTPISHDNPELDYTAFD
jgi:hypothetical protein